MDSLCIKEASLLVWAEPSGTETTPLAVDKMETDKDTNVEEQGDDFQSSASTSSDSSSDSDSSDSDSDSSLGLSDIEEEGGNANWVPKTANEIDDDTVSADHDSTVGMVVQDRSRLEFIGKIEQIFPKDKVVIITAFENSRALVEGTQLIVQPSMVGTPQPHIVVNCNAYEPESNDMEVDTPPIGFDFTLGSDGRAVPVFHVAAQMDASPDRSDLPEVVVGFEITSKSTLVENTQNNLLVLGAVHEVFGPVAKPKYIVRYSDPSTLTTKLGLSTANRVFSVSGSSSYYDPSKIYTKGSDASWQHDEEPPPELLDYSDDEEERLALMQRGGGGKGKKGKGKKKRRAEGPAQGREGGKRQRPVYDECESYTQLQRPSKQQSGNFYYRGENRNAAASAPPPQSYYAPPAPYAVAPSGPSHTSHVQHATGGGNTGRNSSYYPQGSVPTSTVGYGGSQHTHHGSAYTGQSYPYDVSSSAAYPTAGQAAWQSHGNHGYAQPGSHSHPYQVSDQRQSSHPYQIQRQYSQPQGHEQQQQHRYGGNGDQSRG